MKRTKDLTGTIILISIFLIISGLIFYLFFYSAAPPLPPPLQETQETKPAPSSPQTQPSPHEDPKFQRKTVYVIDPRIKVRSEPKEDATVLCEKNKGDALTVSNAWSDWFEVECDPNELGWILKEQVSDRKASAKRPEPPPPPLKNKKRCRHLNR